MLRYTEHAPAYPLPVLAARYRVCDDIRVSDTVPYGTNFLAVSSKWYPGSRTERRPRVLYALWQYPQLSETYIEAEISCMLRWGVDVEVWREIEPASPGMAAGSGPGHPYSAEHAGFSPGQEAWSHR